MANNLSTAQTEFGTTGLNATWDAADAIHGLSTPKNLLELDGLSNVTVTVALPPSGSSDLFVVDFVAQPNNARAGIILGADGVLKEVISTSETQIKTNYWANSGAQSAGVGTGFYAKVSWSGSDVTGSTFSGSVIELTADRSWEINQTTIGSKNVDLTVEISDDPAGNNVLDSAIFSLTVAVNDGFEV